MIKHIPTFNLNGHVGYNMTMCVLLYLQQVQCKYSIIEVVFWYEPSLKAWCPQYIES